MINRRRLLAGLAATPLLAAWGGPSTKTSKGNQAVTFLTAFGTTPRETYAWVGVAKGYFTDAGIDLTVLPGQPSDANLKSLTAGKAQFASLDYVSAVRGAAKFPAYRTICALQNATLLSMVTYTDRGTAKPADLAGKRLGVAPAAASQTLFPAYAKAAGFDSSACTYVIAASDQLPSLLATGRVDAIGAYATDTANAENAAPGKTAVAFAYGKYIGDLCGTVIIATTGVLSSSPDLARRLTAAMVRTAEFAVNNPEESGRLAHAALPTVKGAVVTSVDRNLKPYTGPFSLDRGKVARSIVVLQKAGLAKAGLTPADVVNFDIAAKAGVQ